MAEATTALSTGSQATDEVQVALDLLDELFAGFGNADFAVRLWDGTCWGPRPEQARTILVLRHPGSLRLFLSKPTHRHLAECYLHDTVDVDGDMEGMLPVAEWLLQRPLGLADRLHLIHRVLKLPRGNGLHRRHPERGPAQLRGLAHSLERDRAAVTYHYDVSNRFYSLWLGRQMVYSCALFAREGEDLDRAQERKLEYICRKLRLQRGDRLLDIGCGWGGLILHAARHYGVEGLGITLSQPQADLANERLRAAGLADRCRAEVCDYRELRDDRGFDKAVSIGMVEHVGRDQLEAYFGTAFRLLRPGGTFLNHGIADLPSRPPRKRGGFIGTYVFPDGDLPPIPRILATAEACGFEARDVESLREHYALTLREWVRRLEAHREEAVADAGEATYRIWRLYMSGCAHWFSRGHISVFQALLVKTQAGSSGLPLLRSDWYDPPLAVA
ncbi:MAG: cyclopropane-fatty-acyl-phospholipid synthase family protein [Gemmatimonadota bacterium]